MNSSRAPQVVGLLVVACVVLGLFGIGHKEAVADKAGTTQPATTTQSCNFENDGAPMARPGQIHGDEQLQIVKVGAKPLQTLSLRSVVGTKQRFTVVHSMSMVIQAPGMSPVTTTFPAMSFTVTATATSEDNLGVRIRLRIDKVVSAPAAPDADLRNLAAAQLAVGTATATEGATFYLKVLPNGKVRAVAPESVPVWLNALFPTLPTEPVGIGSTWRITSTVGLAPSWKSIQDISLSHYDDEGFSIESTSTSTLTPGTPTRIRSADGQLMEMEESEKEYKLQWQVSRHRLIPSSRVTTTSRDIYVTCQGGERRRGSLSLTSSWMIR